MASLVGLDKLVKNLWQVFVNPFFMFCHTSNILNIIHMNYISYKLIASASATV